MEGNIIDSSKYKVSLVSLDSRFANQRSSRNGEFRITLPNNMRNVMRIRMASSEIPLVQYEFSLERGNTTFAVKVGAATTFTKCRAIPDGNYTAQKLVTAIETSLKNVHSGFSCSFNSVTGHVSIENSAVTFEIYVGSYVEEIARRVCDWGIGYNIGFEKGINKAEADTATGAYYIEGDRLLILQTSQYYLLQLECPDPVVNVTHPVTNKGFITAFAKVILKDNAYTFNFDDNSNLMRKEFTYLAPHSIPFFNCRLIDHWGQVVDMQNMDWSITIEVTEVVNSRTYGEISKTYSRV